MAQAVEDHRASASRAPRSLYGKIVAEADRDLLPEVVFRRTVQFGMEHYPEKDIWCYTGYEYDRELLSFAAEGQRSVEALLRGIDVLVDGRFVEERKNLRLAFRGSENQRIIDVPRSLEQNKVCELQY